MVEQTSFTVESLPLSLILESPDGRHGDAGQSSLGRRQRNSEVVHGLPWGHLRRRAPPGFDVERVALLSALPSPELGALLNGVNQGCSGQAKLFGGPSRRWASWDRLDRVR